MYLLACLKSIFDNKLYISGFFYISFIQLGFFVFWVFGVFCFFFFSLGEGQPLRYYSNIIAWCRAIGKFYFSGNYVFHSVKYCFPNISLFILWAGVTNYNEIIRSFTFCSVFQRSRYYAIFMSSSLKLIYAVARRKSRQSYKASLMESEADSIHWFQSYLRKELEEREKDKGKLFPGSQLGRVVMGIP